jgi:predicted AAA+ superfamily ATPase
MQGARQTGKSFLWRKILPESLPKLSYESLDDGTLQDLAQRAPGNFLAQREAAHPLVVDEAQKSPALFDAIKLEVDEARRPGRYVLLGSTEFSRLNRIRESLTGRMGRVRVFPLTLSETIGLNQKYKRTRTILEPDVSRYLEAGGLPGICFIRADGERELATQDWIDLVCQRDLHQFKGIRLDSQIALRILKQTATLEEPTAAHIARSIRINPKTTVRHLHALCELFVLTKLDPHPSGTGKAIYLPFDTGLASFLGASQIRRLQILLLNELLVHDQCAHSKRSDFYHYRSTGKRQVHIIEVPSGKPTVAHQIVDFERIQVTDVQLMKAFLKKNPDARGCLYGPIRQPTRVDGVEIKPWLELAIN